MASVIEGNNLYPPIIEDYMPAFVNTLNINYSISPFNKEEDFDFSSGVQISIRDQRTNKSVLNEIYAKNEILFIKNNSGKVGVASSSSIQFTQEDLKRILKNNELFKLNSYYKVQIRFTKAGVNIPDFPNITAAWLNDNVENFTEWSTVCLIRRISSLNLKINNYAEETDMLGTYILSGRVDFTDIEEQESIYSYRIQLQIDKEIVEEKIIYAGVGLDNKNFYYEFKTNLEGLAADIRAHLYITTTNGYKLKKSVHIFISEEGSPPQTEIKSIYIDEENGGFKLHMNKKISNGESSLRIKKLFIKRADSRTGFNIWENVHVFNVNKNYVDLEWEDLFVESGVWYKYAILEQYSYSFSKKQIYDNPVMGVFENMCLTGAEEGNPIQLKIKYNPAISSLKRNVSEQKIDTIGGRFPFVRRNGDTNYFSFNISGLISYLSEENIEDNYYHSDNNNENVYSPSKNLFISLNQLYGGDLQEGLYNLYNNNHNISKYKDITLEREFRNKVIDFLTNNKVKLLKTAQEGNFLIKVTNVNLTPENQLGRYIYSFSCDAFEIAEFNIDNCIKYILETIQEQEISKPQDGIKIEEEFSAFSFNIEKVIFNDNIKESLYTNAFDPLRKVSDGFENIQIISFKDRQLQLNTNINSDFIKVSFSNFNEEIDIL